MMIQKSIIVIAVVIISFFGLGFTSLELIKSGNMTPQFQTFFDRVSSTFGIIPIGKMSEDVQSVIGTATIAFGIAANIVDEDQIPNSGDEIIENVINECKFHADQNIDEKTCVICTLSDVEGNKLAEGKLDLPDGYTASETLSVPLNDLSFPSSNLVQNIKHISVEVCKFFEGCTPGFWRTHSELGPATGNFWPPTGYATSDKFADVFGHTITINFNHMTITGPTLYQAVNAEGGGINALARHSVAALLSAASPDVDYPLTPEQVIEAFDDAFTSGDYETTKDMLAELNEANCPLGGLDGAG